MIEIFHSKMLGKEQRMKRKVWETHVFLKFVNKNN